MLYVVKFAAPSSLQIEGSAGGCGGENKQDEESGLLL
jgi:hypothetical protein